MEKYNIDKQEKACHFSELMITKDTIFQPVDVSKRKTKIICTMGY